MKIIHHTALILSVILSHFSANGQCVNTANIYSFAYNGKSYEVVKENKAWLNASLCAVSRGGSLAEINDAAEQNALYMAVLNAGIINGNTVAPDGGGGAYVWLGGNDLAVEGNWIWDGNNDNIGSQFWLGTSSGSSVGGLYNNWGNEPDDYFGQDALALSLNGWPLGVSGEWNDVDHTNLLYYIIEYPAVACSPTSATISETACDSYISPSGNYVWTNSNTYLDTIPNAANCDSIITVILTINTFRSGTDIRTACDSLIWMDGNTYATNNNTATFNMVGGAANLCDSMVTLDLTIYTVNSSVTQSGNLLSADETGANYQWLNCEGMTVINGATNQSYAAVANGDYAVIVTSNGCSDTSMCYTVTGVGIIENTFGQELTLYPNPTVGNFSIDLGNRYPTTVIRITDLSGRVMQSLTYKDRSLLNVFFDATAGMYLLIIESEDKKAVIRLVKE